MNTETKTPHGVPPPRSGFTNSDAARELRKDACVACGAYKRPYHALCSGCLAHLTPAMRDRVDAADGEALTRAVKIARRGRGLPEDFGVVSEAEARLRAIDDHATVGTHCDGGDL